MTLTATAPSGGYKDNNKDGIAVEEWIDSNELSLIHDPKLPTSFQSARWKNGVITQT